MALRRLGWIGSWCKATAAVARTRASSSTVRSRISSALVFISHVSFFITKDHFQTSPYGVDFFQFEPGRLDNPVRMPLLNDESQTQRTSSRSSKSVADRPYFLSLALVVSIGRAEQRAHQRKWPMVAMLCFNCSRHRTDSRPPRRIVACFRTCRQRLSRYL